MKTIRKLVIVLACSFLAGWIIMNYSALSSNDGRMRAIISLVFAFLIFIRGKPSDDVAAAPTYSVYLAVAGTIFTVIGIIVPLHQLEWLGIILTVLACLRWALPKEYATDATLAMVVIYMIKPIPGGIYENIQLVMQDLSVRGSEYLMHCLNVRVWADGFMLHTGGRVFEVPEACSGMRTAVTVLLGSIGAGILLRLSAFHIFIFSFLGLVQVLAANILRLAFMVYWSERMPPEWSISFLHDTTGILLLAVIALVIAEMSVFTVWWNKWHTKRVAIEKGEVEGPEQASVLPRFWYYFVRWFWIALAVAALGLVIAGAVYKNRPEHKVAMISEVIDGLRERDLAAAERAAGQALQMTPGNREMMSKQIKILTMSGKYAEALEKLKKIDDSLSTYEKIMKSWSLMGVGRSEEAVAIVRDLPSENQNQPSVAIIMAEYSALQNRPADVVKYVRIASRSIQLIGRVRALFVYLAAHGQWRSIVECDDIKIPYTKVEPALIALHANMKLGKDFNASEVLRGALVNWPYEPRLLSSIYQMASAFPEGEWTAMFEKDLIANIDKLDADRLASCIGDSFRLNRPDLAWIAYNALKRIDPKDPALFLAPVKYGEVWFTFRRNGLGIPGESWSSVIDLVYLYRHTRNVEPLASMWALVPLAEQMANDSMGQLRNANIRACLAELDARQKAGTISQRMEYTYPTVLSLAGRGADAHSMLEALAVKYPDNVRDIKFQHAVLYDQEGRWQDSYEIMKSIDDSKDDVRNLTEDQIRINAMMNLNMGVCALSMATKLKKEFPDSVEVDMALAAIWDVFGYKEQAIQIMGRQRNLLSGFLIQLMMETGRFAEADKLSRSLGLPKSKSPDAMKQAKSLPRAEMAIERRWPLPLDQAGMDAEAQMVIKRFGGGGSPFVRGLAELEAGWYRSGGSPEMSDMKKWLSIGRDSAEKASALHRLCVLLGRQGRYVEALSVSLEALKYLPESEVLWRLAVSLSEGRQDLVGQAHKACPYDPEIWLACLVLSQKVTKEGPCISEKGLNDALAFLPVEHVIRAGDFLLRNGHVELAYRCSQNAVSRAEGLLSVYIFGLRCAYAKKNVEYAKKCVLLGIENALDPAPFYEAQVHLNGVSRVDDKDLMVAMEYLQGRFPANRIWGERLGQLYFQSGDPLRALNVLGPVIDLGMKSVRVESIVIAAESARLEGKDGAALRILDSAYLLYPEKLSVLNNYVYSLSSDERTISAALDLLPKLLAVGAKNAAVLDTAATVYFRSGNLAKAEEYMEKALKSVATNDYSVLEIYLNSANIMFKSGRIPEAKQLVDKILASPKRSDFIDNATRNLNDRIRQRNTR